MYNIFICHHTSFPEEVLLKCKKLQNSIHFDVMYGDSMF